MHAPCGNRDHTLPLELLAIVLPFLCLSVFTSKPLPLCRLLGGPLRNEAGSLSLFLQALDMADGALSPCFCSD